ncbi:MAG: hypothetical protein WCT19_00940 [Candidatus Paceibacterota bacterium]
MTTIIKKTTLVITAFSPALAFAASANFKDFVTNVISIFNNTIVPGIFAVAIFAFILAAFKYTIASGDEDKVNEAKKTLTYGIFAIFVMISLWGLVNILTNTFVFPPS